MKYAVWDHAGKGVYLRQQLQKAGHTEVDGLQDADLLLVDCDWRWAHPRPELIAAAKNKGAKVALYPHGGWSTVFIYDGLTDPDPNVDLRLEHGRGSVDIADSLGLDLDQHAPGWLFSPTKPFQPVDKPRSVLFAPQHPNMETLLAGTNGHDPGPKLNQPIYKRLLELGYDLSVSFVGPAWKNGVWPHPRAQLVPNPTMSFQQSWQLIQQADVVVATGTVAATAVASGKPTVMFGQDNLADYVDGAYQLPDHPALYADLLRYPLDVDDGDLADLIEEACAGTSATAEWRELFVGDDGTNEATRLLEELTMSEVETPDPEPDDDGDESEPQHVFIGGVTATAGAAGADEDEED